MFTVLSRTYSATERHSALYRFWVPGTILNPRSPISAQQATSFSLHRLENLDEISGRDKKYATVLVQDVQSDCCSVSTRDSF